MNDLNCRITIVLLAVLLSAGCASRQHRRPASVSATLEREVREILAQHPPIRFDGHCPEIPDEMRDSIVALQPDSSDALLAIIADPEDELNAQATNVLMKVWDSLPPRQIDRYFRLAMTAHVEGRPQYPQGVKAWIGTGYGIHHGWAGWPRAEDITIRTVSYKIVDGVRYGESFSYEGHQASTGGVPTGELSFGRHTVRAMTKYKVTYKGRTYTGKVKSPRTRFQIVKPREEDPLAAANDPELDALVRRAFRFAETESELISDRAASNKDPWSHQVAWDGGSSHMPLYEVTEPLPVDLCFDVEVLDRETGEVFQGWPIVVPKEETRGGYVHLDEMREFSKGRNGFYPVEVLLKPSLATAWTRTEVTKYWVGTITSPVMRAKVASYDAESAPPWLVNLRSRWEAVEKDGVLEKEQRFATHGLVSLNPHWRASTARSIPRRFSGDTLKPILPFLVGLLADVDTELPEQPAECARNALVAIGEPALAVLQDALNSSDLNVREGAVAALEDIARAKDSEGSGS